MFPPIFEVITNAQTVEDGGATLVLDFVNGEYRIRSVSEVELAKRVADGLSLLGTDIVRVFAFGLAPEDTTKPYVTWQVITGRPENYLANRPDIDGYTLQVDVWADDGQIARDVAAAVRDAIEPHAYIVRWGGESRDPDTRAYRLSFDVSWFVHR